MNNKENRVYKPPVVSVVSGFIFLLTAVTTGLSTGFLTGFLSNNAEANDITHCSLELDEAKRETCYQSNPQQLFEQRRPGWPILNFRSYASGNPNASATRMAEEQVMCGGTEGTTSLGLHCVDDGMKVVFSMGCSFGNPNTPTALELLADKKSSEWRAKVFRNQLGLSIDDSIVASRFIKAMQGHKKVVLVFAPDGAPKFVATYNLEGFDKAVERVEELCPN